MKNAAGIRAPAALSNSASFCKSVEPEAQNDGSIWFKFRDLRFTYPSTFTFFGSRSDNILVVWVHVSKDGQVLEEVVGRREAD